MKNFTYIAVIMTLFSCTNGTSEAEEAHIKARITLHNNASIAFLVDSINRRTEITASALYRGDDQNKAQAYSDSIIEVLYKHKNIPYDPNLDHDLSYERFMAYCLQNNLNPIKTVNKLSVK